MLTRNLSSERQGRGQDPNRVLLTPHSLLEFLVMVRVALNKDGEVGPFKVMMETTQKEDTAGTSLYRRSLCTSGTRPRTLGLN